MAMTLGTDNKKKTIWAVVLGVVALAVVAFQLIPFFSGSDANLPAPAASGAIQQQQQATAAIQNPVTQARPSRNRTQKPVLNTLDPTIRLDLLDAAEKHHYEGSGRNIFQAYTPPPSRPRVDRAKAPAPQPQPQPQAYVPPPINLKFYGWASKPGEPRRVFLSQGDEIFIAGEGQLVANRYKVVRITDSAVQIEDILNNNTQQVPIT